MSFEFIIWGAGIRGQRLSRALHSKVVAYIDNNAIMVGTKIQGIPVINYEEYKKKYREITVLISMVSQRDVDDVRQQLRQDGCFFFFSIRECPTEFLPEFSGMYEIDLWGGRFFQYKSGSCLGIYGFTFYSLQLYNYLVRQGHEVYIISNTEGKENRQLIEHFISAEHVLSVEKLNKKQLSRILLSVPCFQKIETSIPIDDVYDWSRKIPEYRNPLLEQFHNIHAGERCFLIGNGPSLRMDDLDCLAQHNEYSFGVNLIYLAFKTTLWRPTYYVIGDPNGASCIESYKGGFALNASFFGDNSKDFWTHIWPDTVYRWHPQAMRYPGIMKFSEDFSICGYESGTITYICLQIAAYMGFKEIVLTGVDFDYVSTDSAETHFTDAYGEELRKCSVPHPAMNFLRDESLLAYQTAKKYADAHGIQIFNATRGGKLEVFTRVDFDELF